MLKDYLSKRLLIVGAIAVSMAVALPTILRHWMIDRFSTALDSPVSMGEVQIYPKSKTLHVSDTTLGHEKGQAYFKIGQSWLTWKDDSWSDGPLRFRRAILDEVQIEADPVTHEYFGIFSKLKTERSGVLVPSIFPHVAADFSEEKIASYAQALDESTQAYRDIWQSEKKQLLEASALLRKTLDTIEQTEQMRPNSLREKEQLEQTMKAAIEARQRFLQAKHGISTFADKISQIEAELDIKTQEDIQRAAEKLRLNEGIFQDLAERMIKDHGLAQTTMWLDYIVTGRSLLGSLQLPEFRRSQGTEFHFARTAPTAETSIDELTLKGSFSLHHRTHEIMMHGFHLRSFPKPKNVTRVFNNTNELAMIKPTVLRGEIRSQGQSLLFDFRRLWENQLQAAPDTSAKFPQIITTYSDVITLESPVVGPGLGEMQIDPTIGLAWQGASPWVWSQWRFDADDQWRAKWVIRQEGLRFVARNLAADDKSSNVAAAVSDHLKSLDRIDIELDITCVEDQYAVTVNSNLEEWLPTIVKMVYDTQEQDELEKIRTAIQRRRDTGLSQLQNEVEQERILLAKEIMPALERLEKLSSDLASKLGVSPRLMLSQESDIDINR